MVIPTVMADRIIQKEAISFEKCLKVITTSRTNYHCPEIADISEQKRVAIFTLADGTLSCDGVEGSVTVSTNMN